MEEKKNTGESFFFFLPSSRLEGGGLWMMTKKWEMGNGACLTKWVRMHMTLFLTAAWEMGGEEKKVFSSLQGSQQKGFWLVHSHEAGATLGVMPDMR